MIRLLLVVVTLVFLWCWGSAAVAGPITLQSNGCEGTADAEVVCDTATNAEWLLSPVTRATTLFGDDDLTDEGFGVPTCSELESLLLGAGISTNNLCVSGVRTTFDEPASSLVDEGQGLMSLLTAGSVTEGRLNMHIADVEGTVNPPSDFPFGFQGTLRFVIFTPPIEGNSLRLSFGGAGGSLGNNFVGRWLTVRDFTGDGGSMPDGNGDPVAVSEPASFALLCAAFLGLGFIRRKRVA